MKKTIAILGATLCIAVMTVSCNSSNTETVTQTDRITSQQIYSNGQVSMENSARLRREAMEKAMASTDTSLENRIKKTLIMAWGEWKPDYEGWLEWSNGLYRPDALIYAIGDTPQRFADYQASMKGQRDANTMEMGPIMQIAVEGNTAALIYHMYLTPKEPGSQTRDIVVTEFNTFEERDGELMVTRLDLYTTSTHK